MSFTDKIANAKLAEDTVHLCLDPNVLVEYNKLVQASEAAQVDAATDTDKRLSHNPSAKALEEANKALAEYLPVFEAVSVELKITALNVGDMASLRARILTEDGGEAERVEFVKEVLRKSAKYVEDGKETSLTDAQWDKLFDNIEYGQWEMLSVFIESLNGQHYGSVAESLKERSRAILS